MIIIIIIKPYRCQINHTADVADATGPCYAKALQRQFLYYYIVLTCQN